MVQVQLPLPFSLGPLVKRSRHRPFTAVTGVRFPHGSPLGSLAQMGEPLPYKQRVSGSSPLTSTTKTTHESEWFFFLSLETAGFPGHTRRAALRSVRAAVFSAPAYRGTRTAAGGFALSGRHLFRLKSSEELRSAERGDSPRPAAGQEGRHQGFYPLNSHFLLGGSGADCRPVTAAKRGTAVGLPQRGFRKIFAVHRQRTATHTVNSTQSAA